MSDELGNTVRVKGMNGDQVLMETDRDLVVEFHKGAQLNAAKSTEKGTPIYDEADFCRIIRPGEPHSVWDQPVRPIDKMRFADKWRAYQDGAQQSESGTPLDLLFPSEPGVVLTLKSAHIRTVQQLANASDNAIGNFQFGHDLREKARRFVAATEKSVDFHKMESDFTDLKNKYAQLEELLTARDKMPDMQIANPRRPGRPRKEAA